MSDDPAKFFVSQSGLQSADGEAPKHNTQLKYENLSYQLEKGQSELRVPLTWTSATGVEVTKTLLFKPNSYLIKVEYAIKNGSTEPYIVNQYRQLQRKPVTDDETQRFIYNFIGGVVSTPEDPYTKLSFADMDESDLNQSVIGGWAAIIQHYFVGAILPDKDGTNTFYSKSLNSPKRYILGMVSEAKTIAPGQSDKFETEMYIGPKDQDRLSAAAEKLNLVVDFGWLTILANPIFWLLKKIHSFVGNWGWSIVLLTMTIKAMFYKLCRSQLQIYGAYEKTATERCWR